MNTPPLVPGPDQPRRAFAHQAATFGLVLPLLTILITAAMRSSANDSQKPGAVLLIAGFISLALMLGGLALAIIALCGISRHGTRGLLGKGIAGTILNGLLLSIFAIGFVTGFSNAFKGHQFNRNIQTAVDELQATAKKSFDPETGITNMDINGIHNLRSQLENAAGTLTGTDALVAKAMVWHTARLETAAKKYQTAFNQLMEAEVLDAGNLTAPDQIPALLDTVQKFLTANQGLKEVVSSSEEKIRADLVELKVPEAKMNAVIKGFNSTAAPRNTLVVEIRTCDEHMGQAMLAILDLLKTNWGKWKYDSMTQKLKFENPDAQQSYNERILAIRTAGQQQIDAQEKLVNLQ